MDNKFMPLFRGSAVILANRTIIHTLSQKVIIDVPSALMRQLVEMCVGTLTVESIVKKLSDEWEENSLRSLFAKLAEEEILIDSRSLHKEVWRAVKNPMCFPLNISDDEVSELVKVSSARCHSDSCSDHLKPQASTLSSVLARRQSVRAFSGDLVTLQSVINMLWSAYGDIVSKGNNALRKTTPSAGALYPILIHLVLFNHVDDKKPAVYRVCYSREGGVGLEYVSEDVFRVTRSFLNPVGVLKGVQGVMVISGSFSISGEKYGNRSMLYVPLEAGHVAQNIMLEAVEHGVATLEIGGFVDKLLKEAIHIPNQYEPPHNKSGILPGTRYYVRLTHMRDAIKPFPIPSVPPELVGPSSGAKDREFNAKLFADYFDFPMDDAKKNIASTSAEEWKEESEKNALNVFKEMSQRVPAYKDFLKKMKVDPEKVKTIKDFENLPVIDKESYLKKYDLKDLSWDGNLTRSQITAVSSGSSGKPFLWPRDGRLELEVTYFFELVSNAFFGASDKSTLVVDCFAMGMYVGGPFFLNSNLRMAQKGYPITVVTPGNVMDDIIRVVQELGPNYEQIILSGYPPFLKDVLENGRDAGIDWSSWRTIIFPAGEGFSELWRKAVAEVAGDTDELMSFLGYYGTADAAVLGFETPWSISIRKGIDSNNGDVGEIFGQSRLPSFLQYIPTLRYLESIGDEIHITTANGSIPLVRYNIGDNGGILTHGQVSSVLERPKIKKELQNRGLSDPWQLPYVYVFGRSDHTAVLYGANIYPENIKTALETHMATKKCSGRFVMEVEEDHHHNQHLVIHIECHSGVKPTKQLKERVTKNIALTLEEVNAEYADAAKAIGERAIPHVFLHEYGDERYFNRQKKQIWKKRS